MGVGVQVNCIEELWFTSDLKVNRFDKMLVVNIFTGEITENQLSKCKFDRNA